MRKKIAFLRVYGSAPIDKSVEQMLIAAFPEYEVEVFTVSKLIKQHFGILFINSLVALWEHGISSIKSRSAFRKAFIATPYLFRKVRRLIAEKILPDLPDYAFSFQLQSLFDLSIPGLPHYVYTDHTHLANLSYAEFDEANLHPLKWVELEKQIYQNADHIFTRSTNISRSLIEQYHVKPDKTTCVYVGVNVKNPQNGKPDPESANKNILFVGIDWERKGGPDLVAAFEKVLETHPDASLTIVGCNPKIDLPNVRVYGRLPVDELQEHYQRASLFCLPTHLEPFGVVFIEAMTFGLPILATQVGAIPDFIVQGENGYMVTPGDIQGLAEKLTAMVGDPELLRKLGARSKKLAKEFYNWETVGERIRSRILTDINRPSAYLAGPRADQRRVSNEQLA